MKIALLLLLFLASGPALAKCRLALALGFDVSNSVDSYDYSVQRDGLIAALQAPEIRRAFLEPEARVALSVFEWGGRGHQQMVINWIEIQNEAQLDAVVALLKIQTPPTRWQPTAIGAALIFARELFAKAPACDSQTLDLSGDGRNNDWLAPTRIYEREEFGNLLVNGLAIGGHEADIVSYYSSNVIRGPGAFVEVAPTHADFPRAIRRKLARELAPQVLGFLEATK